MKTRGPGMPAGRRQTWFQVTLKLEGEGLVDTKVSGGNTTHHESLLSHTTDSASKQPSWMRLLGDSACII